MSLYVDIHKQLNHFHLDVTFETHENALAIFGASGSGKSMTLKCIAGIETPDSGKIVLDGQVLFDSQNKINLPPQKRHVGYLFQNYALFPHLSVLENIMISGQVSKEEAMQLLKDFDLEELAKQRPNRLSGGQQQRVAVCRMLASHPKIILFDEPFSAIDTYLKDQLHRTLFDIIKDFNKDVCLVTHDFKEAYNLCSHILFIDKGQGLGYEDIKEVYDHPRNEKIAHLLGYKNIVTIQEDRILEWNCSLQHSKSNKSCISTQAFYFDNKGIAFDSYEVVSDFKEVEVVFKTKKGELWATFSLMDWEKRDPTLTYINFNEDELIYLD